MSRRPSQTFEEFLSIRKSSELNEVENQNLPEKTMNFHSQQPNKSHNKINKKIEKNGKKRASPLKNSKEREIEELRLLKAQAIEKERMIEKRKRAIIMIQKCWRGFVQYCKFQAYK